MLVPSARLEGRVAAENAVLGPRRRITHEVEPAGTFTDPEYGSVGQTKARSRYNCAVAVARYEDLLRPVADTQPEGFCKLIVETARREIIGAHVLGEYSAEVNQTVAEYMAAGMRIEDVAVLQLAFPTFAEGVGMAARILVRDLGDNACPRPGAERVRTLTRCPRDEITFAHHQPGFGWNECWLPACSSCSTRRTRSASRRTSSRVTDRSHRRAHRWGNSWR